MLYQGQDYKHINRLYTAIDGMEKLWTNILHNNRCCQVSLADFNLIHVNLNVMCTILFIDAPANYALPLNYLCLLHTKDTKFLIAKTKRGTLLL